MPDTRVHAWVWDTARDDFLPAEVRWDAQGVIRAVVRRDAPPDQWVVPGFIDEHVHGAGGADAMEGSTDALDRMARVLARHGVTAFLATTMSGRWESIERAVKAARSHIPPNEGARLTGVHLEGPYLSSEYHGAQPLDRLRPISVAELDHLVDLGGGTLRLVTLAPELPNAPAAIDRLVRRGVLVNLGHTGADFDTVRAAVDAGADGVTHCFNGMPPMHHRAPGPVGLALSDSRVHVELIADGVHVHPAMIRMAWAAARGRVLAVTDGVPAVGLGPGRHRLGEQEVIVDEEAVRLPTGSLAGSKLTMDRAYRNLLAWGLPEGEVIQAVSTSVARRLGLARNGQIVPGMVADLAVLDSERHVIQTIRSGRSVFKRDDRENPT